MSLYQKIKSAITVRQVGEMYGMEPDRHGMVCCPFHSDNHPSMMLNESYYYCFACGANRDAIDLTAKLFDLNPRQAAEKLASDFGLDPYKPATPEEPHDPRFEEALHTTETIEHLTDCVAFGTPQQKADAAARLVSGSYLLMLEERTDRLALAKCA